MFEYILFVLAFLTARSRIGLFLIRRRLRFGSRIRSGCEPFFLVGHGKNKSTGILLIHGFTSSPGELRSLGTVLNKKGYTVLAPLLPGHGRSPELLAVTKHQEWIAECKKSLEKLDSCCKKIFVIGNSMGGNLGIISASYSSKVSGLVCISVPIIANRKLRFIKRILPLMKQIKLFQKKKYPKKFQERVGTKRSDSYNIIPVRSLSQLYHTVKDSRQTIHLVTVPLLIFQSRQDEVMDKSSASFIQNNASSKQSRIIWIDDSMHSVILDPHNKKQLEKEILSFIQQ